jgi:ferric-dicitrate binding protein FerR (iron transport regulator)
MIMESPENNQWLDEALTETIGSEKPRTDFEQWKKQHPEAVKMLTSRAGKDASVSPAPLKTRRIIMTSTIIKLAAAAMVAVAAIAGIYQLTNINKNDTHLLAGPLTYKLADGSQVELTQGAQIRVNDAAGTRGFEHVAGQIDVSVTKGKGQFIVTTPYGNVTALGTQFKMDLLDGVAANTKERVRLLAVAVKEGSVQVSNPKGSSVLKERQNLVVEANQKPYDVSQDTSVPEKVRQRIASMVTALEAGDAAAYIDNYNINYLYKLVKGQEPYDPQRFGGSEADLERLRKGFTDVAGPEQLAERFVASGIQGSGRIYVRSVKLNEAGDHAQAECVRYEGMNRMVVIYPKWHYFDNDWWQVDD